MTNPDSYRDKQSITNNTQQIINMIDLTLFKHKSLLVQRWSDTDAIGHVNNANYLTYFEEARVSFFADVLEWDWNTMGVLVAKSIIEYKAPLFYTEKAEILTRVSRVGGKSFDIEYVIVVDENNIKAFGTTVMVMFDYKKNISIDIPAELKEKMQ